MSLPPYMPIRIREQSQATDSRPEASASSSALCHDLDVTKRDRFELLSAYLDGEVTPEERRMVLSWISNDPKTKCLYRRLVGLREGFREGNYCQHNDADVLAAQVFECLNHRMRMVGMAGLGVFVLGILSVLSGSMGTYQAGWRWASPPPPESLSIALDQPAFPIPKAPNAEVIVDTSSFKEGGLPIDSEL